MTTPSTGASGHTRVSTDTAPKILRGALFLLLLGAIAIAVRYRQYLDSQSLQAWIDSAGIAGPILFMALYACATILFLPGSVLTLAGGAMFGPYWGTLYNLTGATLGATLAFLISRYLASDWVEHKSGGHLRKLKQGVEDEGWRFVAFVRLVPLFPFNLLNYALGLTRIKLSHYVLASYLCMLPGGIAYTYVGYVGREAITGSEGLIQKGLLALGLMALIVFLPRIIKRLRSSKY
ncbi:MAG: TVP38/TMEM64 family protein [Gammaproteobacteria bacterium]|nr:TVP38/TMEM64 family protein [Gammaproteobacteria bacterium]MDH5802267.1 TVP38/TMEM64 family protein [Gammaproteobacteria bacterium]